MLRRAVPRVFHQGVPGFTSVDRPHKGASFPTPVLSTLPDPPCLALVSMYQHLSYFGVRLNLRETERKRRKKVDDPSQSGSAISAGSGGAGSGSNKGKLRDDEESGYED
jgi:hypothetical protein